MYISALENISILLVQVLELKTIGSLKREYSVVVLMMKIFPVWQVKEVFPSASTI